MQHKNKEKNKPLMLLRFTLLKEGLKGANGLTVPYLQAVLPESFQLLTFRYRTNNLQIAASLGERIYFLQCFSVFECICLTLNSYLMCYMHIPKTLLELLSEKQMKERLKERKQSSRASGVQGTLFGTPFSAACWTWDIDGAVVFHGSATFTQWRMRMSHFLTSLITRVWRLQVSQSCECQCFSWMKKLVK